MRKLNPSIPAFVILTLAAICHAAKPPRAEGGKGTLTLATALKLDPEELTKFTNQSEAGQDEAARLYAAAKRVETEHALAQRNLRLVLQLDGWRHVLARCRTGSSNLAYIVNGGGTMYSHGGARDCAPLEDFLAGLAGRLPLAEAKGSTKALKQIDDAVAFIKKLKPFDTGDAKSDREATAQLAAEVNRVTEQWESLKYLVAEVPAAEAIKIASFAVESLGWLKEGGDK